jgi:competence protein ComEC
LHFDFLDVGQGDAALVTFPDGRTLLIDGGGRFRYGSRDDEDIETFEPDIRGVGEAVVSEFLWNKGYDHIDAIVATHADVDHIQGLAEVAANFDVDRSILGRTPSGDADLAELLAILNRRRIPVETATSGDRMAFGGVGVEVLYPPATNDPDAPSDNDHSVVLRITYGSRSFLLTGDIERRAEADLVRSGASLTADLIKVGHHGSRTSSTREFVDRVGAKHAVISVGRSSPFGPPHPDVVDRWSASGAKVITTGEKGTISVSTDGIDLVLDTFQR